MTTRDWTSPKWANTDSDEGAVGALLDRLGRHVPPATIDQIWIFATRRGGAIESTVVVIATFTDHADRRDVSTARFTVTRDRKGRPSVAERIDHHATAPVDAVARVVDGVVRRLGDDAAQPPRLEPVAGEEGRWVELVRELGGTPVAPTSDEAETAVEPEAASPIPGVEGRESGIGNGAGTDSEPAA